MGRVALTAEMKAHVASRVRTWLTYGALLGVSPVVFSYLVPLVSPSHVFSWIDPLLDGELLICSTAIAGAAIGELYHAKFADPDLTVAFCLFCAGCYGIRKASTPISDDDVTGIVKTVTTSLLLFIITMLLTRQCIRIAALSDGGE